VLAWAQLPGSSTSKVAIVVVPVVAVVVLTLLALANERAAPLIPPNRWLGFVTPNARVVTVIIYEC
jgi:hypothetical protein